jgi:GNAT superfamily N-acetyltransferase
MASPHESAFPFADLALARRLERAEGHANRASVEARARVSPQIGACWTEVAGAFAMFDGPRSPLTQTFGLGLFGQVTSEQMAKIESFFVSRTAPVLHEVSPLADPTLVPMLVARGYHPFEFTSVLFRPTGAASPLPRAPNDRVHVRIVAPGEHELWVDTAAAGWAEFPEFESFMRDIAQVTVNNRDAACFLATLDGRAGATGVLGMHEGIALLGGASTIPAARRQGAQLALLDARLGYARQRGCDLAMMGALPGSASQRNAERHGFRIAYTRIKWRLDTTEEARP